MVALLESIPPSKRDVAKLITNDNLRAIEFNTDQQSIRPSLVSRLRAEYVVVPLLRGQGADGAAIKGQDQELANENMQKHDADVPTTLGATGEGDENTKEYKGNWEEENEEAEESKEEESSHDSSRSRRFEKETTSTSDIESDHRPPVEKGENQTELSVDDIDIKLEDPLTYDIFPNPRDISPIRESESFRPGGENPGITSRLTCYDLHTPHLHTQHSLHTKNQSFLL